MDRSRDPGRSSGEAHGALDLFERRPPVACPCSSGMTEARARHCPVGPKHDQSRTPPGGPRVDSGRFWRGQTPQEGPCAS